MKKFIRYQSAYLSIFLKTLMQTMLQTHVHKNLSGKTQELRTVNDGDIFLCSKCRDCVKTRKIAFKYEGLLIIILDNMSDLHKRKC